jgi:alpha-D-xyloside xylohydrolase
MLTIGERSGTFDGMLSRRTFQVVLVSRGHPAGFPFSPTQSKSVAYTGAAIQLKLQ